MRRLRWSEVTHGLSQKGSPEDVRSLASLSECVCVWVCVGATVCVLGVGRELSLKTPKCSFMICSFMALQNGVNDYSCSLWLRSTKGWKQEQAERKKNPTRLLEERQKGAVSCGWHPDRLVWVRNGFPEAPERSRHRRHGNATAWQTACSVSTLTNACCQAGTCHGQTRTHTASLTGQWT